MKLSITLNSDVEKIMVSRQKLKTHFRFLPEFEREMVTSTTLFLFRNAQTIFCSHRMFILVFVILIQEINEAWSSSSVCMATIICVVLLNKLVLSSFGAELVGLDLFFSLNVFTSSITAFCSHFFSNICTFWMFLQFYSESWRFKLLLILILVIEIFHQPTVSHSLNSFRKAQNTLRHLRQNFDKITFIYFQNYKIPARCFLWLSYFDLTGHLQK